MLKIAAFALLLTACYVPPPEGETISAEAVRPPIRCGADGSCPAGYHCAEEINICTTPCGRENGFACPFGWYCSRGGRLPEGDCVPRCWYTDMGCF